MNQQNNTYQSGTSIYNRLLHTLPPAATKIDNRSTANLLALMARFAEYVRFYSTSGEKTDWQAFFQQDISVFLADISCLRLDKYEAELKRITEESGNYGAHDQKQAEQLLTELVELALQLTFQLDKWYTDSFKLREVGQSTKIELILERVIKAELGEKVRKLYAYVCSVPTLKTYWDKYADRQSLHPIWEVEYSVPLLLLNGSDFAEQITFATKEIRLILRTIILSTAYIVNTAPHLLAESLHQKQDHSPDMGLLIAFLRLYKKAQDHLNGITERHLDFYFYDALGLQEKEGLPSRGIVQLILNPEIPNHWLKKGTLLSAGINAEGESSFYQSDQDLYISSAKIAQLKSLFIAQNPLFGIGSSYRLISNIYQSAVEVGDDHLLYSGEQQIMDWPLFGEDQLVIEERARQMDRTSIGFAVASSVLEMQEGIREIHLLIKFRSDSVYNFNNLIRDIARNKGIPKEAVLTNIFRNAFDIELSGEEAWILAENYSIQPQDIHENITFQLSIYLNANQPSIVPYQKEILGGNYPTTLPVLRLMLAHEDALFPYAFLQDFVLESIDIHAKVVGHQTLSIYNEEGLVDNSGPFTPFSAAPQLNSYLLLGSVELFKKELQQLQINIEWNNLNHVEGDFGEYYEAYDEELTNDSFKIGISALSKRHFLPEEADQQEFSLFQTEEEDLSNYTTLTGIELQKMDIQADFDLTEIPPFSNDTKLGYFKLILKSPQMAFGLRAFPNLFAKAALENSQSSFFSWGKSAPKISLPNEPFVPVIKKLSVDYEASSTIFFDAKDIHYNKSEKQEQFFHIHPFGQLPIQGGKASLPYLMPHFNADAYLYIGIKDAVPGEELTILFDLEESRKHSTKNNLQTNWFYLAADEWHPFKREEIITDGTINFTQTGIVHLTIPQEIRNDNQLLDSGMFWLAVEARGNLEVLGHLKKIVPHVVSTAWVKNEFGKAFTNTGEAHPIDDLALQQAAVQAVQQVIPFFGERAPEQKEHFYMRVSERLRHKNRGVTTWDYEHLVLQHFPDIRQVQCVRPLSDSNFVAAGQVKVVVVPQTPTTNLFPKASYHQLDMIQRFLEQHASHFAEVAVINPVYEDVVINCAIVLKKGEQNDHGRYLHQLREELTHFICPWLKGGLINFNTGIKKNDILSFIEHLPFVDFVSAFSIVHITKDKQSGYRFYDSATANGNMDMIYPSTPWSILVPANKHNFQILQDETYLSAQTNTIEQMRLGTDFIIGEATPPSTAIPTIVEEEDDFFEL